MSFLSTFNSEAQIGSTSRQKVVLVPGVASGTKADTPGDRYTAETDTRKRVIARDRYSCLACGLISKYPNVSEMPDFVHENDGKSFSSILEVHALKCDLEDDAKYVSLCPLCHGIFHVKALNNHALARARKIIHAPDKSQEDLNRLSWELTNVLTTENETDISKAREMVSAILAAGHVTIKASHQEQIDIPSMTPATNNLCRIISKSAENTDEIGRMLVEATQDNPNELGNYLAHLAIHAPTIYAQRQKWLGGLRIFYDPIELVKMTRFREGIPICIFDRDEHDKGKISRNLTFRDKLR